LQYLKKNNEFEKLSGKQSVNKGAMKEHRFWAKRKDWSSHYLSIRVKLVPLVMR
jgi:hypothetical protein